ncbi:TetR/AcrR family transcriptional regulator [Sorangium sp. So ce1389]|uniref:TetR/AcrR family transcriptional regulator n=1 Tax=Sorangium sp. So ce1389 TaxID=3133336 RepID=UPI003F623E52
MAPPSRRAPPLPPEARRASIIAATIPLLRLYGRNVTTAQIAMAAGTAEGTLFRVFPDKESLIQAAIATLFDPTPTLRELERIDLAAPLRERLIQAVEILQRRVEGIWQLISMLGMTMPPVRSESECAQTPRQDGQLCERLERLFEASRDELRCDPAYAARLLRMMSFAGTHPRITDGMPLTAAEVVAILLDGIRRRSEEEEPC